MLICVRRCKALCVWFQSLFHEQSPLSIEMKVLYSLPSAYFLFTILTCVRRCKAICVWFQSLFHEQSPEKGILFKPMDLAMGNEINEGFSTRMSDVMLERGPRDATIISRSDFCAHRRQDCAAASVHVSATMRESGNG